MISQCAEPVVTASSNTAQSTGFEALDPRSDNRRRVVDVAREFVTIRRAVAGVSMSIRIASSAYRGVTLRVTGLEDGGFHYEARLLHRDPDLSVSLAAGEDRVEVECWWREWVRFLRLPALVGRTEAADVEVNVDGVDIARRRPALRRRGRSVTSRRPRFLTRRKVGSAALPAMVDSDPDILFHGSKFDR
jgi:Family of unknown function (DUF6101)